MTSTESKIPTRPAQSIAVSGVTGLVGRSLVKRLLAEGHTIRPLVRREPKCDQGEIRWDPISGEVDADALEQVDAVVHLAGENVGEGRWTAKKKERIRRSRVDGTKLLCDALAANDKKPQVLVCASAIGFYGNRGDEILDETASPGEGFLPELCQAWEDATKNASDAGIRTVNLRIGVVLSPEGGALRKMLGPFLAGVGGVIGNGKQYLSWIALDDVVSGIAHAITCESISGPVNCVAPCPVTNREFTKMLGHVLKRPTFLPMPAIAARIVFGQMGEELLLSSTRVRPSRLNETGFLFAYSELEPALRHLIV